MKGRVFSLGFRCASRQGQTATSLSCTPQHKTNRPGQTRCTPVMAGKYPRPRASTSQDPLLLPHDLVSAAADFLSVRCQLSRRLSPAHSPQHKSHPLPQGNTYIQ
eukprot:3941823-Rhodomonas_salina.3